MRSDEEPETVGSGTGKAAPSAPAVTTALRANRTFSQAFSRLVRELPQLVPAKKNESEYVALFSQLVAVFPDSTSEPVNETLFANQVALRKYFSCEAQVAEFATRAASVAVACAKYESAVEAAMKSSDMLAQHRHAAFIGAYDSSATRLRRQNAPMPSAADSLSSDVWSAIAAFLALCVTKSIRGARLHCVEHPLRAVLWGSVTARRPQVLAHDVH